MEQDSCGSSKLNSSNSDLEVQQDWRKIVSHSQKKGFREGAIAGGESVFQTGFDQGFEDGFKAGFALGTYKGALKSLSNGTADTEHCKYLEHTKRGCCLLCKSEHNKTLEDMTNKQMLHLQAVLQELHLKHEDLSEMNLLK